MNRLFAVMSICSLLVACAEETGSARIVIRSPGGTEVRDLEPEDLSESAARLPSFHADGVATTDPARLLEGGVFELPLPGSPEVFEVAGDAGCLESAGFPVVVSWTEARDALTVATPEGELTVSVEGVSDPVVRSRVLGVLAAGFLGADTGSTDLKADFGTTAVVVLAVSYIGCLTGGSLLCSDTAQGACANGVDEYTMICGAGFDVDGGFQLGFTCSFRCQAP